MAYVVSGAQPEGVFAPLSYAKKQPNALTVDTIYAAERGEDMHGPFDTVEELMEALNAED